MISFTSLLSGLPCAPLPLLTLRWLPASFPSTVLLWLIVCLLPLLAIYPLPLLALCWLTACFPSFPAVLACHVPFVFCLPPAGSLHTLYLCFLSILHPYCLPLAWLLHTACCCLANCLLFCLLLPALCITCLLASVCPMGVHDLCLHLLDLRAPIADVFG